MPPKKAAPPSAIRGQGFDGNDALSLAEWKTMTVDRVSDAPRSLLTTWNGKIFGFTSAQLSNDNKTINNLTFHLAGTLWEPKGQTISANRFWDLEPGTSLHFPTLNTNAFAFSQGKLVSNYIGHQEITHEWKKDGASVQMFRDFCLRAFVAPFEEHWANLWILLYPLGKSELLESYSLAEHAGFPGIQVCDVEIPFGFDSSALLPDTAWGSPIAPAVLAGASWDDHNCPPPTEALKRALADTLRTATKPEKKRDFSTLLPRWTEILENGEATLKLHAPSALWPQHQGAPPRRGKSFYFLPVFFFCCP